MTTRKQNRTYLLGGAAGIAVLSALPVQAMAQEEQDTATVADVVVTATRNARLLKDVPIAVDVATGEKLEQLTILDVKDVQQLSPGLEMSNRDGRSNTASLRGIVFDPDSGTQPSVDVYMNEAPVDPQLMFAAMYDLSQIEVLRGPQGILRGRTAPGGAITMMTRRPDLAEVEGYFQATATDQEAYNLQGGVSIPLVEDRLGLRLAFVEDRNAVNYVHNVTRDDSSEGEAKSFRVSLLAKPTEYLTVNLSYQHLETEQRQYLQVIGSGADLPAGALPEMGLVRNGPIAGVEDRIAVSDGPSSFGRDVDLLTFSVDWQMASGTLSLAGAKTDAFLNQRLDFDSGNAVPGYDEHQAVLSPTDSKAIELRYASELAGPFNFQFGAGYSSHKQDPAVVLQRTDYLISGFGDGAGGVASTFPHYTISPVNVYIETPNDVASKSAFISGVYDVTDRLQVNAGIRYAFYNLYQQSMLTVNAGGLVVMDAFPTLPADDARRSVGATTGGASVVYRFNDDISGYVSYGRSFRPGVAAVGNTAPLEDRLVVTKDETSNAVELGVKGTLFDRRWSFTANAFYQVFDDYIGRTPGMIRMASGRNGVIDSVLKVNYNADAIVKGFETTIWGKPTPDWDVSVSASYSDAKYDGAQIPCNAVDGSGNIIVPVGQQATFCDADGKMGDQSPFQLSANTEYRFQPIGTVEPFVRALAQYATGFDSDIIDYSYDDFTNVSLYLGLRGEAGWELSVFAKNLFDEAVVRSASDSIHAKQTNVLNPDYSFSAGPSLVSGYRNVVVNPPREIGVSLRLRF
ncbi:TonB-dependent receptor [Brevundimonas sp. GN22]